MKVLATALTAPNIALVKYWGKLNQERVLPYNSSLSLTLDHSCLRTQTKVYQSQKQHSFVINGKTTPLTERQKRVLSILQQKDPTKRFFRVQSFNHFPTASGMASSASGFSALVLALRQAIGQPLPEREVEELTRLGSGSAIRSLRGGLVEWREEGIVQHMRGEELKQLRVMAVMDRVGQKQIKSTKGMRMTLQTSDFIKMRPDLARQRIDKLLQAFRQDRFSQISEIMRKESNGLHALCLDTLPPIFYLTDFSKRMIEIVEKDLLQACEGQIGYTFDAGSHCFLIYKRKWQQLIAGYLSGRLQLQVQSKAFARTSTDSLWEKGLQLSKLSTIPVAKCRDVIVSPVGTDPIVK